VVIGDSYKIIDNDSNDPVAGTFEGLPEGETFRLVGNDDIGFKITYKGGDGNDVVLGSIPTLTIADASVSEPGSGTATANFAVKLNQASNETITVKYATSAGSALPGDDYNVANGTLTFNPGETVQTIKVEVVSDAVDERDETFSLKLFTPTNASIAQDLATGTITPPIADGNPNPGDGNGSGNGNTGGNGSGGGNGAADSGGCGLGAGSRGSAGFAGALLGALLVAFALRQSRRRL
ncbi:MAG: transporter, partial [Deltaproteobacteria bacterium]|nr:transporter [Deltaproteobacteria bacterium]